MIVNSVWKSLAEAQLTLMDAGCSQEEAQRLICQGIADKVVKIRCKLGRHKSGMTASKTYLDGDKFQVAVAIAVEAFDWEKSRPLKTWYVERGGAYAHGEWTLERIELFGSDIAKLSDREQTVDSAQSVNGKKPRIARTQPMRGRAQVAINALWPEGVPNQAVLPNGSLCKAVIQELRRQNLALVSDESILRAAGRRRK